MARTEAFLAEEGIRGLTPDAPAEIIADISHSPQLRRYKEELIRGEDVQMNLARARQIQIKRANDRLSHCFMDGVGQRIASIDKHIFHRMCLMHGRHWFRDKACLRDTLQRHPELAIRARPGKLTLRVQGLRPDARKPHPRDAGASHGAQGEPATPERRMVHESPSAPLVRRNDVGHGTATAGVSRVRTNLKRSGAVVARLAHNQEVVGSSPISTTPSLAMADIFTGEGKKLRAMP